MKLAILVPTHGQWAAEFGESLASAFAALATQGRQLGLTALAIHTKAGSLLPKHRDDLVKEALAGGADWLMWMDCDMNFPPHLPLQLLSHGQPIVGINYSRKDGSGTSVAMNENDGRTMFAAGWDGSETGLAQVDVAGFGGLLVKREVYEKLEQPWHPIGWNSETGDYVGEDLTFCRAARAAGYRVLIDCDLSHEGGHIGSYEYRLPATQRTIDTPAPDATGDGSQAN